MPTLTETTWTRALDAADAPNDHLRSTCRHCGAEKTENTIATDDAPHYGWCDDGCDMPWSDWAAMLAEDPNERSTPEPSTLVERLEARGWWVEECGITTLVARLANGTSLSVVAEGRRDRTPTAGEPCLLEVHGEDGDLHASLRLDRAEGLLTCTVVPDGPAFAYGCHPGGYPTNPTHTRA